MNIALLQHLDRRLQHIERLQTKEVKLHQTRDFNGFHVELRGRQRSIRIAVQRNQLDKRAISNHHARRMGGGVAVKPFQLQRDIHHLRHGGIIITHLL